MTTESFLPTEIPEICTLRMGKDYYKIDNCATCVNANWNIYAIYREKALQYNIQRPYYYCITPFCFIEYRLKRKPVRNCKDYLQLGSKRLDGSIVAPKHKTWKKVRLEALVKTEQISEYILPPMLETHGKIIRLLPNEDNAKKCGYIRSAKDTPFQRDTIEFYVEFAKDKFRKKYTMNKTTFRKCAEKWGDDSDKWVNHEIELEAVAQLVRGEKRTVLYGEPLLPKTEK